MSTHRGVVLVVGAGVLIGAAVAALYVFKLGPRAEKRRVAREVEQWGAKWTTARHCLVGDSPRSSDGREAVVLRELTSSDDVVDQLRACGPLLAALHRGQGPTAGDRVEAGWSTIKDRLQKLAEAHAWRIARTPNDGPAALRLHLGDAVTAMDAAYADLRARAELSPAPPAGHPLPRPASDHAVATPDGRPVVPGAADPDPVTANVVAFFGTVGKDTHVLVRQRGPSAVQLVPFEPGVVPAVAGGWGAWPDGGGLMAGPLDATGHPTGPGVVVVAPHGRDQVTPLYATSGGHDRLVAYRAVHGDSGDDMLARSHDDGATWTTAALHGGLLRYHSTAMGNPALGRLDLTWPFPDDHGGRLEWAAIDSTALTADPVTRALLTPAPEVHLTPCVSGDRSWWWGPGVLYAAGAEGPARPVPGATDLGAHVTCDGSRFLTVAEGEHQVDITLCSPTGCQKTQVPLATRAVARAALGARQGPLLATATGGVAVLWAGDPAKKQAFHPTRMVRLPDRQRLAGVLEWKGAPYLVTHTKGSIHLLALGTP